MNDTLSIESELINALERFQDVTSDLMKALTDRGIRLTFEESYKIDQNMRLIKLHTSSAKNLAKQRGY